MNRLLIIAGSDSGGGAGIQGDIKTATAFGVFAMTAVTAITVQDTTGVHGIVPIPEGIIADQMRVCLTDIGADAVKTGMLATASVIEAVADILARYAPNVPLVVDPVMVAKGGARLVGDGAIEAMKRLLIPRATLLTPNAPEAAALVGAEEPKTAHDLLAVGRALRAAGARAVLVKGGHLPGDQVYDGLLNEAGEEVFSAARIASIHTHGTGCTLASAIASALANGRSLRDAVIAARAYVRRAIEAAPRLGRGHGPLNHMVRAE